MLAQITLCREVERDNYDENTRCHQRSGSQSKTSVSQNRTSAQKSAKKSLRTQKDQRIPPHERLAGRRNGLAEIYSSCKKSASRFKKDDRLKRKIVTGIPDKFQKIRACE